MTVFNLSGSATDDGLPNPPAALTYLWTKISGPGAVTFANAAAAITTVTFDTPGAYVLRLTANDSSLTGFDELTVTVDEGEHEGFVPPDLDDPVVYAGNIIGYVLWDSTQVVRTWDMQATSPIWELVDTGVTGTIYDGQYVHRHATAVGMWLLTSDAVWWCANILATTPSWSAVLTLATVIAAEVAHPVATHVFKSMFNYATEPGYLIVATGPNQDDITADSYSHAYFWHTHDYGATWTTVDMTAFTFENSGITRCYFQAGHFAINIFRSAPGTIYALRHTPRVALQGRTAVFLSSDLGHTWTKGYEVEAPTRESEVGGLLNPYPSANDPTYLMRGAGSAAQFPSLYKSTDGWVTGAVLVAPTGYDNTTGGWRPNKRTFDNTHIMMWWRKTSGSTYDLLETFDQGATWNLLYASGLTASPSMLARHNVPNGWPPDVLQWVMIKSTGALGAPIIQLTLNNFATLLNREGNLASVIGTWTSGYGNGFALPKVGTIPTPNLALWWLEGGVAPANAIAAYRAIGAADLAGSYINLANPGVFDAAPGVAPTWSAVDGWTFNGTTQYLTSGVTPATGWSMIVRFASVTGAGCAAGETGGSNTRFYLFPQFGADHLYGYAGSDSLGLPLTVGTMAIAANDGYIDGHKDGLTTGTTIGAYAIAIGALNSSGVIGNFMPGKVQAVAIYNTILNPTQVARIEWAMRLLT